MNVVTSGARHRGRFEALTPFQKSYLITMDVKGIVRFRCLQMQVIVQDLARGERKHRSLRDANSAMAQSAEIELPFAG